MKKTFISLLTGLMIICGSSNISTGAGTLGKEQQLLEQVTKYSAYSDNEDKREVINNVINKLCNTITNKKIIENIKEYRVNLLDVENLEEQGDFTIIGWCNYVNKKIDVAFYMNDEDLYTTFFHEIGHAIDCEYGESRITEDKKYIDIYCKESDLVAPKYLSKNNYKYYRDSLREYFAQSFAKYMYIHDKGFEDTETYKYIDRIVKGECYDKVS